MFATHAIQSQEWRKHRYGGEQLRRLQMKYPVDQLKKGQLEEGGGGEA